MSSQVGRTDHCWWPGRLDLGRPCADLQNLGRHVGAGATWLGTAFALRYRDILCCAV